MFTPRTRLYFWVFYVCACVLVKIHPLRDALEVRGRQLQLPNCIYSWKGLIFRGTGHHLLYFADLIL